MRPVRSSSILSLLALAVLLLVGLPAAGQSVPKDTVVVDVVESGKPVPNVDVKAVGVPPGGGEVGYGTQKTDANGRATFHVPFRPGLEMQAHVFFEGIEYKSEKESYAGSPANGLHLSITVFEKTGGGATLSDISFGPSSHLVAELGDDYLDMTEVLDVVNGSKDTFAPKNGLVVPLPAGFYDVNGVNGKPIYTAPGVGARVPGPFMPGKTQAVITFKVPHDGHTLQYRQKLTVGMGTTQLIIEEAPGLSITGPAVGNQGSETNNGRELHVVELSTKSGAITFDAAGLPYRTYNARWVAVGTSLSIVLVGLVLALGANKKRDSMAAIRENLEAEREELLADLEQLERDRADGEVDDDDYADDRQAILDRLADILRTLEQG